MRSLKLVLKPFTACLVPGAGLTRLSRWTGGPQCDLLGTAADIMRPVNKHLSPPANGEPTQPGSFLVSLALLLGAAANGQTGGHENKEAPIR